MMKLLRLAPYLTVLVVLSGCSAFGQAASGTATAALSAATITTPQTTRSVSSPATTTRTPATSLATSTSTSSPRAARAITTINTASTLAQDAFALVAQLDTPGVVQITNEQVQLSSFGGDIVPAGAGTGIVIDHEGHILTNDHVIRGAQRLLVTTADGAKQYPARLVGADPRTDLAVVQVQGANLTPLPLGDSDKLQVGQWVVAIGNALALRGGPTVTTGVVSALGRTVQEPATASTPGTFLFDVIQTSAPINPGNSGGPLVDLQGRVIGINTLQAGQSEPGGPQAQGIGFAIAINTANRIAQELIKDGHVTYAYLGVTVTTNSAGIAAQFGFANTPGALVVSVNPSAPAEQAGIRRGDVITKIDTHGITSTSELLAALQELKPGQKVNVTWVNPRGATLSRTVTLGAIQG
ncbi:MAG: trypsin-like peptidase domain-containing protein [Chloroflexi bacterium]|nr:trypsin-like peptidase domain-containing protein [Chloroflexota bacterium]